MGGSGIRLCILYNDKYNEESRKYYDRTKLLQVVHRMTSYSTLWNKVLMKLPFHLENCDVKLKTQLSLFPTDKFLYNIKSNKDLKVAFDEYVAGMTHMVIFYVEMEDKYILKKRNED